jgi:hypothetical protein
VAWSSLTEFGLERVQNFVCIAADRFTAGGTFGATRDLFGPSSLDFCLRQCALDSIEAPKKLGRDVSPLVHRQAQCILKGSAGLDCSHV